MGMGRGEESEYSFPIATSGFSFYQHHSATFPLSFMIFKFITQYRSWGLLSINTSHNTPSFFNEFSVWITIFLSIPNPAFIVGDFNIQTFQFLSLPTSHHLLLLHFIPSTCNTDGYTLHLAITNKCSVFMFLTSKIPLLFHNLLPFHLSLCLMTLILFNPIPYQDCALQFLYSSVLS